MLIIHKTDGDSAKNNGTVVSRGLETFHMEAKSEIVVSRRALRYTGCSWGAKKAWQNTGKWIQELLSVN